jgi:hypothetical protein
LTRSGGLTMARSVSQERSPRLPSGGLTPWTRRYAETIALVVVTTVQGTLLLVLVLAGLLLTEYRAIASERVCTEMSTMALWRRYACCWYARKSNHRRAGSSRCFVVLNVSKNSNTAARETALLFVH